MAADRRDLISRPEYFAERENANGPPRFYWKASARLAALLHGAPHVWAKGVVRLSDDRAEAERQCAAITAEVKRYVAGALASGATKLEAPHSKASLREIEGTLANIIAEYRTSPRWQRLARATQKQYDWIMGLLEDWAGHARLPQLTFERIEEAARRLDGNARTQELFVSLLAMLIDRAAGRRAAPGELVANPARLVLQELDRPEAEGGWIWPRDAVARFARAAEALGRPSIATAIILNEWLAQRTGDLLAFPRTAYREGVLHVVQSKTGQYVPLPLALIAPLKARLDWQLEEEARARGNVVLLPGAEAPREARTLLVCETTREAWKLDYFRHEFARIRAAVAGANDAEPKDLETLAAIGLGPMPFFELDAVPRRLWRQMRDWKGHEKVTVPTQELRFYHLRHTGITRLRQAGCDDEMIRAISGHTQPSTVYAHYLAVTVESARSAFAKREAFEAARK